MCAATSLSAVIGSGFCVPLMPPVAYASVPSPVFAGSGSFSFHRPSPFFISPCIVGTSCSLIPTFDSSRRCRVRTPPPCPTPLSAFLFCNARSTVAYVPPRLLFPPLDLPGVRETALYVLDFRPNFSLTFSFCSSLLSQKSLNCRIGIRGSCLAYPQTAGYDVSPCTVI